MKSTTIHTVLRELADPERAKITQRFFKTGEGEYGAGDKFLGVRNPVIRQQVKIFKDVSLSSVTRLLKSRYHEERLFAVFLLVHKYTKGDDSEKTKVCSTYLKHTRYVNNWDLVDSSAYQIVGRHYEDKNRKTLYQLAKSKSLWERRIAIISTYWYIKRGDYKDTVKLSVELLHDDEDLIHKAVGWMLREVGNRDRKTEEKFLARHYKNMPRTMLRYAIEKFPETKRKRYLAGKI